MIRYNLELYEKSECEEKNAMPKINIKKIPRQTQIKLKTNQILSMQKTIDRSLLTVSLYV